MLRLKEVTRPAWVTYLGNGRAEAEPHMISILPRSLRNLLSLLLIPLCRKGQFSPLTVFI